MLSVGPLNLGLRIHALTIYLLPFAFDLEPGRPLPRSASASDCPEALKLQRRRSKVSLFIKGSSHGPLVWAPTFFKGLGTIGPDFEGGLEWCYHGYIRIQN